MAYLGSPPASQFFAPGTDTFSGTGSQTTFTLSRNVVTVNDIQVVVNNVVQQPSNYTVSSNILTFSPAPSSGTNNIYVRYLSTNLVTIAPQQGSVYPSSLSTQNAVYWDTSGNVGVGTTTPSSYGKFVVSGATVGSAVSLNVVNTDTSSGSSASSYVVNGSVIGVNYASSNFGFNVSGSASNHPYVFITNNAERMRVLSTGNILSLSGGSTTATGTGIAFPATQASSSDVNTLDDYEEGTWTPVLVPLAGTITGQTTTGNYTKIGRQVTVTFQATINSGTITSISGINNLPFAVSGNTSIGVARENAATGTLWQLLVAPSFTITFYTYANISGASSGYSWLGTATYFTST